MSASRRERGYVEADGVRTYYEAEGDGEPVILLHGGMTTVETFEAQTASLAVKYRVYVPERRGHGRTHDVEGPFTYDVMARDTIAFMNELDIESAHLVGWSDGAVVALLVALEHPALVRKLVLIGQYINLEGARPEQVALMNALTKEHCPPSLVRRYEALSPDGGDHFGVVFEKLVALWRSDPGIAMRDLAQVKAPTLVLVGDDDCVRIEHVAAMQRALPDAQLAVVPGTSHALLEEKPELVNRLLLDFLAPVQVRKVLVLSELLGKPRRA